MIHKQSKTNFRSKTFKLHCKYEAANLIQFFYNGLKHKIFAQLIKERINFAM